MRGTGLLAHPAHREVSPAAAASDTGAARRTVPAHRAPAARAMPGSGLGLAIVAQTAAQHGGSVVAGPHHPHGTHVTVRLPRLREPGAGDATVSAAPGT
ncbi:ATP-binding protein, partial [Micromonospora harpali]